MQSPIPGVGSALETSSKARSGMIEMIITNSNSRISQNHMIPDSAYINIAKSKMALIYEYI
jgi:hypothetical protein